MRNILFYLTFLCSSIAFSAPAHAKGLEAVAPLPASTSEVSFARAQFKGRAAVRMEDMSPSPTGYRLMMLPVQDFHNGTIEAMVAGFPQKGAGPTARGFIGLAFRVQKDVSRYEAFYLRPTNGRADDQLRRNRSTQYIGMPDFPWERLRAETPGVYESYADMVAGEWTRIRIEVDGGKAQLYVGSAKQPALIVNDLKLGSDASGGIALWIGPETEGYFADVKVTKRPD